MLKQSKIKTEFKFVLNLVAFATFFSISISDIAMHPTVQKQNKNRRTHSKSQLYAIYKDCHKDIALFLPPK